MKTPLDSIVEIHPTKDELIIINRYETIAVSKGTAYGGSLGRGIKRTITVYEIDGVITYTIHHNTMVNRHPLFVRHVSSYKVLEYPISKKELFEHFLVP